MPCLWTSFSISPNCSVRKSKPRVREALCYHMYWLLLTVGLMSEVATCLKSCPALYNSSAHLTCHIWPPLGMADIFTEKMSWHAYLKYLPKQRTEAKPRLRLPLGNREASSVGLKEPFQEPLQEKYSVKRGNQICLHPKIRQGLC